MSHVPPGREDAHEPPRHSPARDQPAVPVTATERLRASAREPVIAVDAMGGDYAPDEIVAGALAAQREHGVTTLLTGPPARLRPVIARLGGGAELRVVPAEDVVGMGEGALAGFRRPRSSIAVACQLVRSGQANAVVSAGSTGAIVASARHRLLPLANVPRPGLAVLLPTHPKPTVLIDAGSTADPKPEMLVQFGQLGVAYAQIALGIREPQGRAAHYRRGAGQGERAHQEGARAARRRAAARRAAAELRRQRRGRRPDGRRGRRDRHRRLHRQRGAQDPRGGHAVRRGRAADRADQLQRRPGSAPCCSAAACASSPTGWSRRATAARRCSGSAAPW